MAKTANVSRSKKIKKMKRRLTDPKVPPKTRAAVRRLEKAGYKVAVVGSVVNGKIELHQSSLTKLEQKYPNAAMSFIAVNAPFDPVQSPRQIDDDPR